MSRNDRWSVDDLIAADRKAKLPPTIEVSLGMVLTHRASGATGEVVAYTRDARVVLQDPAGTRQEIKPREGAFSHKGTAVTLGAFVKGPAASPKLTASGSIDAGPTRATVAKASRIWVEGIHDAELLERIWGDDLRIEGIVVEPLHGADDLLDRVHIFEPSTTRRLGVLLDHLVDGSKESRIAATVTNPNVLILGHPYIDIWAAIRPEVLGMETWPKIPHGTPWKEGVVAALGVQANPGEFWQSVLSRVSSYRDVETPLITAVETLIDFVTVA